MHKKLWYSPANKYVCHSQQPTNRPTDGQTGSLRSFTSKIYTLHVYDKCRQRPAWDSTCIIIESSTSGSETSLCPSVGRSVGLSAGLSVQALVSSIWSHQTLPWTLIAELTKENCVTGCSGKIVFFYNSMQPHPRLHRCKRPSKLSTYCERTVTPNGW